MRMMEADAVSGHMPPPGHSFFTDFTNRYFLKHMLRYLFSSLLLLTFVVADASAQTRPRAARKKVAAYSTRGPRKAPNINPHTGKPFGAGVSQDIKDGTAYLAPGVPMRKQEGYRANGGYNDNRTPRPRYTKPANSSLSRDNSAPAAPAKTRRK
jgi:hypothetical protein